MWGYSHIKRCEDILTFTLLVGNNDALGLGELEQIVTSIQLTTSAGT
jgi:hypothetical protein